MHHCHTNLHILSCPLQLSSPPMPSYLTYKHPHIFHKSAQSLNDAKDTSKRRRHTGSPFDKLPNELQIEIFISCLPELPHFDIDEGPLLISRVCKAWKNLTLNTPKLWSAFEIEVTGSGRESSTAASYDKYVMDTMDRWLKRSKACPLTIRIVHIPVGRVSNHRSFELVSALLPQARRWKNIQLILPASDVEAIQKSLPIELPQLQSLGIKLNGQWSSNTLLNISAINIPWHQLSDINLQLEHNNLPTLDRCLEIVAQTETLRSFTASAECNLAYAHTTIGSVSLPFLESLDLTLHDGGNDASPLESHFTQFLSSLSLPKLSNLRLGWSVQQASAWSPTHSKFIAFLRSVASTLESLSIGYLPFSEPELMECMTELPGLRQLDLRFSFSVLDVDPITDAFFSACTSPAPLFPSDGRNSPPQTQPILPLLQSLTLQCYGKWYSNACLAEFFESRLRRRDPLGQLPTHTLESFRLRSLNTLFPSMGDLLRYYRDEGADVWIDTLVI